MCICINCRHINKCQTYLFITKQHSKSNKLKKEIKKMFNPINNIVNINIKIQSKKIILDWDLTECLSFTEKPGYWLKNSNDN